MSRYLGTAGVGVLHTEPATAQRGVPDTWFMEICSRESKEVSGAADFPMIVRAVGAEGFIRVNDSFRERVGFSPEELAAKDFIEWIDPKDRSLLESVFEEKRGGCRVHHKIRSGGWLPLNIHISDLGTDPIVLGRCVEASGKLHPGESEDKATVSGTLGMIARIVEEQNPGYRCSILLVEDGRFVRGAGPSLPEEYNAAIDGYAVGPTVGSCGTAIYWNVPVIVDDIQADPLWVPFAALAKKAGVAACWSHPFTSTSGNVLGALALYSPEPRSPTAEQLGRLRAAARMTGLAVERGRAEEALREKRKRELELEEQLRQAAKMEALGVLAGGVAHDFNNVLSTILANTEFALELLPEGAEVASMLEDVVEASRRAGQFCQQMLAYAGRGGLKTQEVEIGALLPELSSLVQAAVSKKASLEYALHEGEIFVKGDENQLLQVVMNLVTNAAEALGDNQGRITIASKIGSYTTETLRQLAPGEKLPAGEYVEISVSDTGCGMNEETRSRIFDPFYTTKATGRGLGLSAVKGIITKHRGVIRLTSEPGHGTTFTILLPTIAGKNSAKPKEEVARNGDTSRKQVLVVDDDPALRAILCKRLRHSGFAVLEASDGKLAVDIFCEHMDAIDVVLLDVSMPKLSGEEVHQQLRSQRDDVPIVLMSGFNEDEIIDRMSGERIDGTLQKPITAEKLMSTIHHAMSRMSAS